MLVDQLVHVGQDRAMKDQPPTELKTQRIPIMMALSEVEAVDTWMFANRLRSRSDAIRKLVAMGLVADADRSSEPAKGRKRT